MFRSLQHSYPSVNNTTFGNETTNSYTCMLQNNKNRSILLQQNALQMSLPQTIKLWTSGSIFVMKLKISIFVLIVTKTENGF